MPANRTPHLPWAALVGLLLAVPAAAQPARGEQPISNHFEVVAREVPTAGEDCGAETGDDDQAEKCSETGIGPDDPRAYLLRPPGRRDDRELVVRIDGLTSGREGRCRGVGARFTVRFPEPRRDAAGARDSAPVVEAVAIASMPADGSSDRPFADSVDAAVPAGVRTVRPEISASVDDEALWITVRRLDLDGELPRVAEPLIERFLDHGDVREHLACLDLEPRNADGGENPSGAATRDRIRRAVAEALPRTFEDAFGLAYGVSTTRRHVNLEPGMRLCVSSVDSLRRQGNGIETLIRQGPRQCIPVGWRHDVDGAVVVFEPLLSRFTTLRIGRSGPGRRQVADGVDLSDPTSARRFFRIFYPPVLDRATAVFPARGAPAMLVGVDSSSALDAATAGGYEGLSAFCDGHLGDPVGDEPSGSPVCYRFAEQAVPVAEIRVELRGEPAWVPVGTTLFDVLARVGVPDLDEFSAIDGGAVADRRARRLLAAVELKRRFGFEYRDIRFSGVGTGALHLPLVQGDRVQW